MKVALAQLNTVVGDLAANAARTVAAYQQAVAQGADLVVCPELTLTGYPPRDLLAKRRFVDDSQQTLEELATAVGSTVLVVGYVAPNKTGRGRPCHNAAAVLHDGRIVERRYKTLLPNYDVFDEDRYFEPAADNLPVVLSGRRLGITVCEDVWTSDYLPAPLYQRDLVAALAQGDHPLDLLLNLSASPFHLGKGQARYEMLRQHSRRYRVPLIYCNLVGGNDELIFDGTSLVFDAAGNLLAQGAAFAEDLLVVDLDQAQPRPFTSQPEEAALEQALVLGLRDYVGKCGFRSAVVGLSGGIDSAVTACLAVAALGAENVRGLSLPSRFSSPGSLADARQLAKNLGIRYDVVSIQPVFEQLLTALKPVFAGRPADTAEENLQARIRGTILMAISNKFGDILLTTGNKSELAVGYCTLYGDMAGGLAVIADVPKTMVYRLARQLNRDRPLIPEACLTKPPSAELRPDQTDQDSLPPYEVLDTILRQYVEEAQSATDIVAGTGLDEALVRDVVRKIDLNEYKRKQAPPCLRVTTKAFGIGRRVPVAQRYVDR